MVTFISVLSGLVAIFFLIQGGIFLDNSDSWLYKQKPIELTRWRKIFIQKDKRYLFIPLNKKTWTHQLKELNQ